MSRSAMMELIKHNIERSGRHLYSIMGGESPRFLYTIGVWRKADAEVVLAGCCAVPLPLVADLLNEVGEELEAGKDPAEVSHTLEGFGTFTLRKVHASWTTKLLLGALDYYEVPSIAAWQLTLDAEHATIDQPDMTKPYSPEEHKVWQWVDGGWPYKVDPNTPVVSHLDALKGRPVLEVLHWHDGQWEMFSKAAGEVPTEECFGAPLATLVASDSILGTLLDLPPGYEAVRDIDENGNDCGWEIYPLKPG